MKSLFVTTAVMASVCAFAAETINFTQADFAQPNIKTKDGVLVVPGAQMICSKKTFKVEPGKTYKLSADARTVKGGKALNYFGYQVLDEKGAAINPNWVNVVNNGGGELAAACKKGDTQVKVKVANPNVWKNMPNHYTVAFDAKDDLSDIPNKMLTSYIKGGANNKIEGNVVTVQLQKAANFDRPAGTKVRAHSSAGYMYVAYQMVPDQWTAVKMKPTKGISKAFSGGEMWWKGAKNARLIILPGWGNKNAEMEFKNVKLVIE